MKNKSYKFMLLAGFLYGNAGIAWAENVVVDGLSYQTSTENNTARLTPPATGVKYAGEITVPASFTYEGQTYNVTAIDQDCFYENESVTSIVIQAPIQAEYSFMNCTALKYVSLPDGITELNRTFYGCSSLTDVHLPSDLQKIGSGTFENCSSLKSFSVPASVTEMENSIFTKCTSLTSLTFESSSTPLTIDYKCFKNLPIRELHVKRDLAFYDDRETLWNTETLETAEVGGQATEIPIYMFDKCINLKNVSIGGNVNRINRNAFANCTALEQLEMPNSMRRIESNAFEYCSGLQRVTFQEGITIIERDAFSNCTSLSDIQLPSTLTTIGESAFEKCSLQSILIPSSVDSIGDGAFTACKSLSSATLPAKLKRISPSLFYDCSALQSVVMPTDLEVIGNRAFFSCGKLLSITLGDKLTTIGDAAFYECKRLEAVNYKGDISGWLSLNFLADSYPEDTNPLSYADKLVLNYGTDQENILTDLIVPKNITAIKSFAFWGYQGLTSLVIPVTVKRIEESAFECCYKLKKAEIRAEEIKKYAFQDNMALKEIKLGRYVKKIETQAFGNVRPDKSEYEGRLEEWCQIEFTSQTSNCFASSKQFLINGELLSGELKIPATLTKISPYAFVSCQTITSCIIPENVREIGKYAFNGCSKLESISFVSRAQTRMMKQSATGIVIGEAAFEYCKNLSKIDLPQNVVSIGSRAFNNTAWFEAQPEGVIYLSDLAYQYKGNMPENTTLTLKDGVTGICNDAFSYQASLVGIHFPKSLENIGEEAFASSGLVTVSLPDQIKVIGKGAFKNCQNLTSFSLPKQIEILPENMLSSCTSLTFISIPASVKTIGDYAFKSCGLTEIISFCAIPPTCESSYGVTASPGVFYGIDTENCVLKIPTGTSKAYAEAPGWAYFYNVEEFTPTSISSITINRPQGTKTHFDLTGRNINAQSKGIHLIRDAQGNTRKVLVK